MSSHVAPNYHPLPVTVATAAGAWVTDVDGRRYLDCLSGYSALNFGHSHPEIVETFIEQSRRLTLTSRAFQNDQFGPFCDEITRVANLDLVLPMNTGAEAVETAIKAARRWGYKVKGIARDRAEIIVAAGNFHGRTTTVTSFSTEPDYRDGFGPFTPGFVAVPFGDLNAMAAAITPNTAAIMVEPIQGEAGIIVPPPGWLAGVRKLCDENRVLLIVDEVQTGLGRTGKWFAFQHEDVRPDGVILGKALGGGVLAVSALVGTRSLMDVFTPGSHGSTFGGNPLACSVGLTALRVMEEEGLVERSRDLGAHMMKRLHALESPAIKEVRGLGLFAGIEIEPAFGDARLVCEKLLASGVLSKETHDTVIRLAPPLVIAREDLDWALDRIAEAIRTLKRNPHPEAA